MESLSTLLNNLDDSTDDLISLGKKTVETYSIYNYDLFCIGVLNRSVNLIRGFTRLVRDNNFIAAGPLVRIHLDTLLRLYASTLVSYGLDEFALKVLSGKKISNLKDSEGNRMTDGYLASKISEVDGLHWVPDFYKTGSGYVHFSDLLIFKSTSLHPEKERVLIGSIGKHDEFINENEKISAAIRMNQVTINIAALITLWKRQKENYQKLEDS